MAKKEEVIRVPADLKEAAVYVAEIGTEYRASQTICARYDDEIAAIQKKKEEEMAPHEKRYMDLSYGLYLFATPNRNNLLLDSSKTVNLQTGSFSWRWTKEVEFTKNIESIIRTFKRLKLRKFIRTKESVNKNAVKADPENAKRVSGLVINSHENFLIKPSGMEEPISLDVEDYVQKLNEAAEKKKKELAPA